MKKHILNAALVSLLLLSACGQAATDTSSPEAVKAAAERIEGTATADLSKMEISEIIDFVEAEALDMTELLKTVTDGPSAESAVEDIRATVPKLNAAIQSLDNMESENLKLSFGTMRKMLNVAQSQAAFFTEVQRISQIPEARAVLEKEFDKIEITGN